MSEVEDYKGTIDGGGVKGVMSVPKSPIQLICPQFIQGIAEILLHGMIKYAPNNWMRGMSWTTVYGGIQRHLNAWFAGEDVDKESKKLHLFHAACGLMFLCFFCYGPQFEEYEEFDDRVFMGEEVTF